ncbi:MAG: pirin family protein [Burkholderiales bacterium]|nr:pirin family protein [Burkholderiales bacterium]
MNALRRSNERGHADHGWLKSYHSFSFADYYDPAHMGYGPLRVINDDRVAPGAGFGTHAHRDMEIISYVLTGELAHKDSLGNGSVLRAGDVQRMSAGRGVLHSEFNQSTDQAVHFLQIWIEPNVFGIPADYQQRHFSAAEKRGKLVAIAGPEGQDGQLLIRQDARLLAGLFDGEEAAEYEFAPGRKGYLHVAQGEVSVNGTQLSAGDAMSFCSGGAVSIGRGKQAEILLFDMGQ